MIRLADGDEVVGAVELATGDEELCFVTSDAQLLHFAAAAVRPQGRSGGGIAGVRLAAGARGGLLRRLRADRRRGGRHDLRVEHRAARHGGRLGQGDAVRGVPRQGPRAPAASAATASSRARTPLVLALGRHRAAAGRRGLAARRSTCPPADGRRDGSGTPAAQPVAAVSGPVRVRLAP